MAIKSLFFTNLQFPVITQEVDEGRLLSLEIGVELPDLKYFLMYLKKFSN